MRQLLNTPFFQVQAIRRQLRDSGRATYPKPGCYPRSVSFTGTLAGEIATESLTIDSDSDFVWTHLYHYFQNAIYDPAVGSTAANNQSGQFLDVQGSFLVDVKIRRSGGRVQHDADFAFDLFSDAFYSVAAGVPGTNTDEAEQQGITATLGSDINTAISIYRSALMEPVLLPASSQVLFSIRRRLALASRPLRGHLFLLSGVRLFPVGGR